MVETMSFSVVVDVSRASVALVTVGFVVALDSDVAIVSVDGEGISVTGVVVVIE